MQTAVSLLGGQVLSAHGEIATGDVHIADGRIVERPTAGAARIDCRGCHVLPAIVDVHGDAWEHEVQPRPGVDIALPIALPWVDRQLLANGITTAFHGLTLSWEPGARSLDAGRRFMDGLSAVRSRLTVDHRVQLRWETFAHETIADVLRWLGQRPTPVLAFNDHTTATMEKVAAGKTPKLGQWAQRAGLTPPQYLAMVEDVSGRGPQVPARIAEVAAAGRRHGAVMLSHDERTLDERHANRALGMTVCEFPLEVPVAADAVAAGEHVVLGAPNVIRGGSHTGAMSAEDAIRDNRCSVLASDYYYPSLLHAIERLVGRGVLPLAQAWPLISTNAAASMRLDDRGRISPGLRADVVVIDTSGLWRPVHTIAAGRVTSFPR